MKFNKWTLGLATAGVVSLASAASVRADSPANPVQALTSGIMFGGYVDTSIEWGVSPDRSEHTDSPMGNVPFRTENKQDGFNLNAIELNFEKAMDESPWASGFKVQLIAGPDAVGFNSSLNGDADQDIGIKQAYVALRTPVGNGIDWKIGVFDTIIGYEVFESGRNPNFTRSWGWAMEPTQHEGILGSYKVNDNVSFSLGVANTLDAGIGNRNTTDGANSFWHKTVMGSVTLTAPQDWGFLGGSALYLGIVDGFSSGVSSRMNFYAGAVVNTPVTGLTAGIAFDYLDWHDADTDIAWNVGVYASYKATEKLSFHARAEYGTFEFDNGGGDFDGDHWGLTGTIQYDLWANVISRLEIRYEKDVDNEFFGEDRSEGIGLYANFIYTF